MLTTQASMIDSYTSKLQTVTNFLSNNLERLLQFQIPNYQKHRVFVPLNQQQSDGHSNEAPMAEQKLRGQQPHVYNATKFSGNLDGEYDGKRIRKTMVRKTVDYNTAVVKYLEVCSNNRCIAY